MKRIDDGTMVSVVGINESELEKKRYDLILRGVVLGLKDLGIKDISIGHFKKNGETWEFDMTRKG